MPRERSGRHKPLTEAIALALGLLADNAPIGRHEEAREDFAFATSHSPAQAFQRGGGRHHISNRAVEVVARPLLIVSLVLCQEGSAEGAALWRTVSASPPSPPLPSLIVIFLFVIELSVVFFLLPGGQGMHSANHGSQPWVGLPPFRRLSLPSSASAIATLHRLALTANMPCHVEELAVAPLGGRRQNNNNYK